jgi:DNA-binding response OmpR family regulator
MADLLIVDDTAETCDMLARLFSRCGHSSACLYGGADVISLMHDRRFDLVLLDVMMPGMDGFEVLAAIRGNGHDRVAKTPVAMYTAICDPAAQQRALDMGADEWIIKGTPFPLLRKRLECFLTPGALRGDGAKSAHA